MDLGKIRHLKWHFIKTAQSICPGFTISEEQKSTINDIFNWCIMANGKLDTNKGLWIHGEIGSGKTTMLKIVKRFCHDVRPMSKEGPYSFRISNAIEVCSKYSQKGYEGIESYINSLRQAFDEIGSESIPTSYFGNMENVFQYILQRRYDLRHNNFTHVTTNLTIEQIADVYKLRIYDRCKEMFNFVEFNGVSWR